MFINSSIEPLKFDIYEVQPEMSNREYHSRSEISSSFIKGVSKHSVGKARVPLDLGPTSRALLLGDAFHEYMELGALSDRFIVMPAEIAEADGRTKLVKDWKEEHSDKSILSLKEFNDIQGMHASVLRHPFLDSVLDLEAKDEWSFFADGDDQHTKGMKFRIRPDRHLVNPSSDKVEWIVDWKTTEDIQKLAKWGFIDLGYDVQAVFYSDMLGVDPSRFVFVVVEKSPPYSCRVIKLKDSTIEYGREKMIKSIGRISLSQSYPDDPAAFDIDLPQIIEL